MQWFMAVLRKYAVFDGRASRSEYWYFVLFYLIIAIVLGFIDRMMGTFNSAYGVGLLSGIFELGVLLPAIGVGIRRMHDTGRSGWWILINLLPLVGWIWWIILAAQDSQPGDNRFGPNPKGVAPAAA